MNQTTEDRIAILRECFGAGSASVLDVSGAFQVDFGRNRRVYVYVETYDGVITARYETKEADARKRLQDTETVQALLQNEVPVAKINGFGQADVLKNRFIYTTSMEMDPSVFYHQTLVIGDGTDAESLETSVAQTSSPGAVEIKDKTPVVPDGKTRSAGVSIERAIREMELVDAKLLRQGLDMMNLKRSSLVRAALNRLFRSIGDAEELAEAVSNEAAKIVSSEDQEDLRMIRTIHTDGFLRPAIDLLYDAVFHNP